MPESALWVLIVSLGILAFGLTLKIADLRHRTKRSEKEASSLRSELDSLNETHNKEISDIKELHLRETAELTENVAQLTQELTSKSNTSVNLNDEDIKILLIVASTKPMRDTRGRHAIPVSTISEISGLSDQQTRYHLDRLRVSKCVFFDFMGRPYAISPGGRELLHDKGMLP